MVRTQGTWKVSACSTEVKSKYIKQSIHTALKKQKIHVKTANQCSEYGLKPVWSRITARQPVQFCYRNTLDFENAMRHTYLLHLLINCHIRAYF